MAKTNTYTQNTAPLGKDSMILNDDPDGTFAINELYLGDLNMLPDGHMINGKLDVTVSSNNITVRILTRSGGVPSATDPVSVWINGTYRRITGACSTTKNAGTNWFGSGSAHLATVEVDYFAYLIWNTTPATDIMDIGFARVPNGRIYSDFSGTTTNDKYLAYGNASAPNAADDCVVIGRFAATLSATASFNWSVPTYTGKNLIHQPIFHTRRLLWVPGMTGYSAAPTNTVYEYMIDQHHCHVWVREATNGTSNGTGIGCTAPITAATLTNMGWGGYGQGQDNTAALATPVYGFIATAGSTFAFFPSPALGNWTGSGTKAVRQLYMNYGI